MAIDAYRRGDENRLYLLNPEEVLGKFRWILELSADYFRYQVYGLENLPLVGGGLLVSNHGTLAVDAPLLVYRIYRETDRVVRGLGSHVLWNIPILRVWLLRSGVVDGNLDNAVELLQKGGSALVYPGGSREGFKPSRQKYELFWDGRYGFVKAALLARVPIIPVASIGVDDTYWVFNYGLRIGRLQRFSLPLILGLGPVPFPVQVISYIGRPLFLEYPPEAAEDLTVLKRIQEGVKTTLRKMLAEGLSLHNRPLD